MSVIDSVMKTKPGVYKIKFSNKEENRKFS